jgi:hypothetical protein
MMGDILSKLICCYDRCDKVETNRELPFGRCPSTPVLYRHTEIEQYKETLTIKSNIPLTTDELATAIKFYSLKHNKI